LILFYRGLISTLGVQGSWQKTQEYLGSFEIVLNNLKSLANNYEWNGNQLINNFKYIEFSNVFFKYSDKDKYSLKNLNLKIPSKKSIAFVGASGAGKSTIANLFCLLLEPNRGDINIDEIPLKKIDKISWRRQIGYVSQEMAIFDNTIGYNISLNKNYKSNKKLILKIKENAKKANIDDFISTLPDGYETIVGENGLRLSGGQKQRLFIARELYRDPKILILDEATSSLDTLSEKAIKKSISLLKGKITIILIAHRISTIKDADFIYVIDKGSILEKGNYLTLKSKKDSFFNYLISSQKL
jgi:subfamily B ATP-binding cassette protein MsbA